MTNNDFDTIMHTPDDCKGDTMTAKLNRAKLFNSLASQSELIRLEALCHIADSLDLIAAEHREQECRQDSKPSNNTPPSQPANHREDQKHRYGKPNHTATAQAAPTGPTKPPRMGWGTTC